MQRITDPDQLAPDIIITKHSAGRRRPARVVIVGSETRPELVIETIPYRDGVTYEVGGIPMSRHQVSMVCKEVFGFGDGRQEPLFEIEVDGRPMMLPLREAFEALNDSRVDARLGERALDPDGTLRQITPTERQRLAPETAVVR